MIAGTEEGSLALPPVSQVRNSRHVALMWPTLTQMGLLADASALVMQVTPINLSQFSNLVLGRAVPIGLNCIPLGAY